MFILLGIFMRRYIFLLLRAINNLWDLCNKQFCRLLSCINYYRELFFLCSITGFLIKVSIMQ
jgi:hypothetical protein